MEVHQALALGTAEAEYEPFEEVFEVSEASKTVDTTTFPLL